MVVREGYGSSAHTWQAPFEWPARVPQKDTVLYTCASRFARDSIDLRLPLHFQVGVVCGVGDLDALEIEGSVVELKQDADAALAGNLRTFVNAVICFIGSGVLGLPFAFQHVGLAGGLFGLSFVAVVALHCMSRQMGRREASRRLQRR